MLTQYEMTWLTGAAGEVGQGVRTKAEHPYSYDPFTTWMGTETADGSLYTDRLLGWGFEKHDRLCVKHFGNSSQYWGDREPQAIEAFLRDYLDAPNLVLCEIQEHCNHSNGSTCWWLSYRKTPKHPAAGG